MGKNRGKKQKNNSGWRIIFRYLLQHRNELIFVSVLGFISALANGTAPYIVGAFFDAILAPQAELAVFGYLLPLWVVWVAAWLAIQLIANISDWVMALRNAKLSKLIHAKYLADGFSYLLRLPLSFHNSRRRGEIGDNINRAGMWLWQITENVLVRLAPQFLSVAVGLVIAFLIEPVAGFLLVAGIFVYAATLVKIGPKAAKLQRKAIDVQTRAYGDAFEAVVNVDTVKQFTAEKYEAEQLQDKFVAKSAHLRFLVDEVWQNLSFYQRMVVTAAQLGIFVFSVFSIFAGTMTVGDLIALNGYALLAFGPFVMLGHQLQTIKNGVVSIEETEKILSEPAEKYHPAGAHDISSVSGDVVFHDVSFRYSQKDAYVLRDISFNVKAGETVAIVGESGVGKSTIMDLIGAYYFPTKGSVLIDDIDTTKMDLELLRRNIAIVPQEVVLFNDTVENNIRYSAPQASHKQVIEAAQEAKIHEFIESLPQGYKQNVGERGVKLSVGQKQRVGITRAILRDPKILILDEPTSALDAKTEQLITQSLDRLIQERTTFIIAHRLSTVRAADKIIVLDKGRVAEAGTHEELMENKESIYHQLYEYQIGLFNAE